MVMGISVGWDLVVRLMTNVEAWGEVRVGDGRISTLCKVIFLDGMLALVK